MVRSCGARLIATIEGGVALLVEVSVVSTNETELGYLRGEDFWFIVTFQGNDDERKMEATKPSAEKVIKDLRRMTRKQYGAEEKIRIVLDGLRGEESIAALCRREGIAESLLLQLVEGIPRSGKKRLAGDTARAATTDEVKVLRKEARDLKEVVAEQALELRLLKKSMIADGGDDE